MQTATSNSFFLKAFPSFRHLAESEQQGGFYQQLVFEITKGTQAMQLLNSLGERLIAIAQHGYLLRSEETVQKAGEMLAGLPLPGNYRSIGLNSNSQFGVGW